MTVKNCYILLWTKGNHCYRLESGGLQSMGVSKSRTRLSDQTANRPQRDHFSLLPYEDTTKRLLSMNQEMGSHQTLNFLASCILDFPVFRTVREREREKKNLIVYKPTSPLYFVTEVIMD